MACSLNRSVTRRKIADATGVAKERFCQKAVLREKIYCADRGPEAQYEGNYNLTKIQAVEQRKPQTVDSSANDFVYAIATLTFSGTYPTCGDTLAFKLIADNLQSTQMVQVFKEEPAPNQANIHSHPPYQKFSLDQSPISYIMLTKK
jgi:hypothetical protein